MKPDATIVCKACGLIAPRTGTRQFFCSQCSALRHRDACARYYEKAGYSNYNPEKAAEKRAVKEELWRERSIQISKSNSSSLASYKCDVFPEWTVKVAVPYSRWASKNARFGRPGISHIDALRKSRDWQRQFAEVIAKAMDGRDVRQNKLWIEIFVQKTDAKSDAINFIDLICDAVKQAIPLDDKWYCIRHLDWEIVKYNPRIFVGLSQEDVPDVQACSYCGRLLTFDRFNRKKTAKAGIDRVCKECKSVDDAIQKEKNTSDDTHGVRVILTKAEAA